MSSRTTTPPSPPASVRAIGGPREPSMPSEITIRLSQAAKDQLAWLKRHTGLTQWNELCRWGLALCHYVTRPHLSCGTSPPTRTWRSPGGLSPDHTAMCTCRS
ncbi:DndE family protein [Streptomyces sp. CBG30]|uniref:DndE family protein n=1 Tax=Streptomyces sp. CBG30 TaxID=2838869 RepID=UPI0027E46B1F|nr:DndE family protein [Streptomyces sp. CBG30]